LQNKPNEAAKDKKVYKKRPLQKQTQKNKATQGSQKGNRLSKRFLLDSLFT